MTNKERILKAINFEATDQIPYQVSFGKQAVENMIQYTGNKDYMHGVKSPITSVDLNKPQENLSPDRDMDEFGVIWNKSGADKDIGVIEGLLIEDEASFEHYTFPPVDEAFIREKMERLVKSDPDNFKVAMIGFSLFERAWTLTGMENLLCAMVEEPEFVHKLIGTICERNLQILDIALEYPFDCFHFGDDWGQQQGLIMGAPHWREFIKPYLKKMYDKIHAAGRYVSQHSCGDIRPVMEDLYEIGLNIYQTFQPEIYGLDYGNYLHKKIAIWGGISTQADLPSKTPEEIRQIVRNTMKAFPNGGIIIGPTHALPFDVPPENIEAMLDEFEKQGK